MADKENTRPWAATSIKSKGSTPHPGTMTRKGTQLISSDQKRGVTERSGRGVRVLSERGLNNNVSTRIATSSGRAFTLPSKSVAGPKEVTDVDPPASTSRFEGPLRVRVENSRPRDMSLSFWSPPTFTEGDGGEPTKTSLSSVSAAVAAVRPTVTSVPSGLPEATSGSALMRSRSEKVSGPDPDPKPTSDRRNNIASRLTPVHNRSSAGGSTTAPGKQLSTEKKRIAAATTSTGAQSSTDCGGAVATGDAAGNSSGRGIRAPPFGSDISHILNWKPAHKSSGTPPNEASTNAAPSGNKNSVPQGRVVLTEVETPTPLPKATVPSLNALRVPVASSKRMFDEGVDVDYDSEEERKTKEDNISVGEGRGKDGEDNRDKNLIGDPEEASKRRKRHRPSVESSSRGSSNVGANHGAKAIEGTVVPSSPEMPISRGNPGFGSSSVSRSSVSKEHDKDQICSLPESMVGDGSRVQRGVPRALEKETGIQGKEEQLETAVGKGEEGVTSNPGVMGDDDSASLTAAAGGFKSRRSSGGGGHGRDFSPRNKSSFLQTNTRVSEVLAVSSGAGFGAADGGVSSSNTRLHENPRKVAFAHVPRTLGSEVVVNGKSYWKTAKIGRGGSSEVFRVVSSEGEMFALKIVRVEKREEQSRSLLDSYSNEIELLKRLKGNRFIISLENAEVDREAGVIYIVLELGETDLDRLLQQHKAQAASTSTKALGMMGGGENDLFPGGIEANFVRVIWQQMLKAVNAMHEQRVVHGDLKPANFVLVRGSLKLIDFGIAKAISNDTTNISRDSRLGTMNYMCPEAFEDTGKGAFDPTTGRQTPVIKLGRASDIWSLGCILYQMTHGRTPFSHLDMLQKMRAITNRSHVIHIAKFKDTSLVQTLRGCLQREPSARSPISGAVGLLSHPYLHPVAARVLMEEKFSALVNEKITAIERDLKRKHELLVAQEVEKRSAEVVAKAVAAEQSRQAAGLSIAKSAVKKIIVETVRVLKAEEVLRDRGGLNCVTAMVMGSEMRTRGAAGNHSVVPPPSTRQQQ